MKDGTILVKYLPTHEMLADVLTKALGKQLFADLRRKIGVVMVGDVCA